MAKNTFNEIQKKVSLLNEMEVHDIGSGTGLLLLIFLKKIIPPHNITIFSLL